MSKDPFARGPHPVGVRSVEPSDERRDRRVPLEVWYPATRDFEGADLDPQRQDRYCSIPGGPRASQTAVRDAELASGSFPLVVFSHGFASHRRQTSHLCAHLASHGYLVGSVDHLGNTVADVMQLAMQSARDESGPLDTLGMLKSVMNDRPADLSFAIDCFESGRAGLPESALASDGVGVSGHSFGGWTTLRVAADDPRIRAAMPLAPAGARSPLGSGTELLESALGGSWSHPVPTLCIAAELDTLLPLGGIRQLFARLDSPKRLVTLHDADHMHFCDRVEETHEVFRLMGSVLLSGLGDADDGGAQTDALLATARPATELCPGSDAYLLLQGLGVLHMDAHLKRDAQAHEILRGDLQSLLAQRGVSIEAPPGSL